MKKYYLLLASILVALSVPLATAAPVPTAVHFGSGLAICQPAVQPVTLTNPTTITDCTQAGVQAALQEGGHIQFACGPNPITIPLNSTLITNGQDTVLDGGGLVTLDGQNQVRILEKPYSLNSTLVIQNMRFVNGRAPSGAGTGTHSGGAIRVGDPGTRIHLINSTFANNHTSDLTEADNQGGVIFAPNSHELLIEGSLFENNSAGNGGAIGVIATGVVVHNSRFVGNAATDTAASGIVRGYGGAIHIDGVFNDYNPNTNEQFTVCGSDFVNNSAVRGGGALSSVISDGYNTLFTVTQSNFDGNSVSGLAGQHGQGGAIYHIEDDHVGGRDEDNLLITHNTFHDNGAGRQGGAVWLYILGRGQFANNTLEANRTTAGFNNVGQGGAMAINLGNFHLLNNTFANNHADYQGGAIMVGGQDPDRTVLLTNNIFLNNTLNIGQTEPSETRWQGFHTNRTLDDGGQNIQEPRLKPTYDNDVNNLVTAAPIFANPLLLPLSDNGGPNRTMGLQVGSPAINAGTVACPLTDQRGAPRIAQCDIGAFEYGGVPPVAEPLLIGKTANDLGGTLNTSEAIAYRLTLTNQSGAPVVGTILTDTLPIGVLFGGWVTQGGAEVVGNTVSWAGDVAVGETVTIVFTATVTAEVGTLVTNTAEFSTAAGQTGQASTSFTVGQSYHFVWLPLIRR